MESRSSLPAGVVGSGEVGDLDGVAATDDPGGEGSDATGADGRGDGNVAVGGVGLVAATYATASAIVTANAAKY